MLRATDKCITHALEEFHEGPPPTIILEEDPPSQESIEYDCCNRHAETTVSEFAIPKVPSLVPDEEDSDDQSSQFSSMPNTPVGSSQPRTRTRSSRRPARKSEELVVELRGVISRWINSTWAAEPEDVSIIATGRNGILPFHRIEKVARLALKLGCTVSSTEFPDLLTMVPKKHNRVRLTDILDAHTSAWDVRQNEEELRSIEEKVRRYEEREAGKREWQSDAANAGLETPAEFDHQGEKIVSLSFQALFQADAGAAMTGEMHCLLLA
jgi:hypothetical protein